MTNAAAPQDDEFKIRAFEEEIVDQKERSCR